MEVEGAGSLQLGHCTDKRWATVSGIHNTYVYILYIRHEDAILTIPCTDPPIAFTTAGEWLNSLIFRDIIQLIIGVGR